MSHSKTDCRFVFAGTPDFAAIHLQALIDANQIPIAVYTQPDRPAGRGKKLTASAVKQVALAHDIPIYQPLSFKDEAAIKQLQSLAPELMIVVAYGLILPERVLTIPSRGCVNVHGSLLPRWRGAAPIQRAIAAGDTKTGVCLMQMEKGLDTGPVFCCSQTAIDTLTAGELHDVLAELGANLLVEQLSALCQGQLKTCPQDEKLATYAHKLSKQEAHIDWQQSAHTLLLKIRAFNPWPVCFSKISDDSLRIWNASIDENSQDTAQPPGTILSVSEQGIQVQTAEGILNLEQIQLPGKKKMAVADIMRGQTDRFQPGMKLQ